MEKWFIKYSVKIESGEPLVHPIEFGIVCAESLGKAAEKLEDFYGPDLLEILQLKYLEEGIMTLPREVMKSVEEALEP
jgi:hypothetical protein